MNAYKSHSALLRGLTLTTLIVVSLLVAILLASALNSFTRVSDSALADTAPTTGAFSQTPLQNAPRAAPGKNYLPIIFLNAPGTSGFWSLTGNASTVDGTNFLGTTDNVTLTFRVSNTVALRIVPVTTTLSAPNIIGGYSGNTIAPGIYGATIGGGGTSANVNSVNSNYGTIAGGVGNSIPGAGTWAFIGGGYHNTASGSVSTVGGGDHNAAGSNYTTIGGGIFNTASDQEATIGGGYSNTAGGFISTIGGGSQNTASDQEATIGGGESNTAGGVIATVGGGSSNRASGYAATVGGGESNFATGNSDTIGGGIANIASITSTTIAGGFFNTASDYYATVGGGSFNTANGVNAIVGGGWNNNASNDYATVGGGDDNTASGVFATIPGGATNHAGGDYSFAAGYRAQADNKGAFVWADTSPFDYSSGISNTFKARATNGVRFTVQIDGTGADTVYCHLTDSTSGWNCTSDRNVKENFSALDGRDILARLSQVPITQWNIKGTDPNIKHIGPVAQDFYAAFHLGNDDKTISAMDEAGVAFAAIQGLAQENQDLKAQNAALKEQFATYQNETNARLTALEQGTGAANGAQANPLQGKGASALPVSRGALFIGALVVGGFIVIGRQRRA